MINRADYNFIVKYGDLTPDGVAVYDLNSRTFVYLNRFIKQIFGEESSSFLHQPESILSIVHPDDLAFVDNRYRELLSIGCIAPSEFRIVTKEGQKHVSAEVLWLEESYTFAIFVRDVSVLRQNEDYVHKVSAQKDALLDTLIHNLSGPLYMSRDALTMVSSGKNEKMPEINKLLELIQGSTEQCIDIINEYLEEEHVESARTLVRKTRFDVEEKINICLQMLKEMYPGKKFIVSSRLENRNISSDPVKFLQVINNILSNSVKYTGDATEIHTELIQHKEHIEIVISDNGTGIPGALKDRIFKERVLGSPGLKGEKSNGMGLLIVKRLVSLMGGDIWYESVEEEGTKIFLKLPIE